MAKSITDVLTDQELESILHLDSVIQAKEKLQKSKSVSFSIQLPMNIRESIQQKLGIGIHTLESIPMRWIQGDTLPHIDRGLSAFQSTYLMYLNDSPGELVIENNTYPISKGTAYIFSEGLHHETRNTEEVPRLLLGPMSEAGFAVGSFINIPGGSTLSFRQNTGNIQYSFDLTNWTNVGNNYPLIVANSNPSAGIAIIEFITDITFDDSLPGGVNKYFVCGSSDIQFGSTSLKNDGTRPIITIDGVINYPGLIQNGTSLDNGQSNIYVYNLEVHTANGSTLQEGGGWICGAYFGKNSNQNYIINCSSTGNMPGGSGGAGGIVGSFAGTLTGAELYVIGCSSSGSLGQLDGGIVGSFAGQNGGSIYCRQCWTTGAIQAFSGGIFGDYAGDSGYAEAVDCYTTGSIGSNAGGIFGRFAGNGGTALAQKCYSQGTIGTDAGGIYGIGAGSDGGTTNAINCYSLGTITTPGRGIYGTGKSNGTEINCYVANGSWSSVIANSSLQGTPSPTIGTTWVSTGTEQPYELYNMGYTPYTIQNIITSGTPTLKKIYTTSISSGSSSIIAVKSGQSYTILQITGGNSNSYNSISINSTTGMISTSSSTKSGIYTLYIRNNGSYNISIVNLTITGNGSGEVNEIPCCARPLNLKNVEYFTRNKVITGNNLIGEVDLRIPYPSYQFYYYKKMAYASKY